MNYTAFLNTTCQCSTHNMKKNLENATDFRNQVFAGNCNLEEHNIRSSPDIRIKIFTIIKM
jgi:hypothetical protein